MKPIDRFINDLENTRSEKKQDFLIKNILGEIINSEIEVSFKGKTKYIKPIWCEAYYYIDNYHEDYACHRRDLQKVENKFKLYFHSSGSKGRNYKGLYKGFDLVLKSSNRDLNYYFSVLLKCNIIDGQKLTEYHSSDLIAKELIGNNYKSTDFIIFEKDYYKKHHLNEKKCVTKALKNLNSLKVNLIADSVSKEVCYFYRVGIKPTTGVLVADHNTINRKWNKKYACCLKKDFNFSSSLLGIDDCFDDITAKKKYCPKIRSAYDSYSK